MGRKEFEKSGFLVLLLIITAGFMMVPAFAMTAGAVTDDAASLVDRYKLKMIQVSGKDLPGFQKDQLDYTYDMSAGEEAALNGAYDVAVTADLVNSRAQIIKSLNGNKVLLYVNNDMDPDGITYSITFLKNAENVGAGLIQRENSTLSVSHTHGFSVPDLKKRTRASLNSIIAEIRSIEDPVEAEKAYLALQSTLTALVPVLDVLGTDAEILQDISDMTNESRHLVRLIADNGKVADLTAGYFEKMGGVFGQVDTSSTAGTVLKDTALKLAAEGVRQTGLLKVQGKEVISFAPGAVSSHLVQAKLNFGSISEALNTLLGSSNPRKLVYQITLKADRSSGVNRLETTLEKSTLDSIWDDRVMKLELQLGEAAVAFEPGILGEDEKNLKFSAAYTPSAGTGLPGGTRFVPGILVADVTLSSDTGPKADFESPVLLTFDLTGADLAGYTAKNLKNLGLYLQEDATGTWIPVGGNVDPVTKTIRVYRLHLSKYTVLKTDKSFSDVQNSWAKDDINELLGKGVVKEDPLFSPKGDLTREDFARWIAKAYGLESAGKELPFKDVTKDHPYYKELAAVYSQGLIKGKSATVFDPKGKITRQEMATLISNALVKYQKAKTDSSLIAKLDKYPDSKQVAGWAKETVAMVNEMGIMQGDSRGFRPNDYITREEAAKVLKRVYN